MSRYGYLKRDDAGARLVRAGRQGSAVAMDVPKPAGGIRVIPRPTIIAPRTMDGYRPAPVVAQDVTPYLGSDVFTQIFTCDADPETSSVDGHVGIQALFGITWAQLLSLSGNESQDDLTGLSVKIRCDSTTDKWDQVFVTMLVFDISGLPTDATPISATVEVYDSAGVVDDFDQDLVLCGTTTFADTALQNNDYNRFLNYGPTEEASNRISVQSIGSTTNEWKTFFLNEAGLARVQDDDVVRFAIAMSGVVDNVEPAWVSGDESSVTLHSSENVSGLAPQLVVRYTT